MRTLNLKFFEMFLFIVTFIIGGLFINVENTFALDVETPHIVVTSASAIVSVAGSSVQPTIPLVSCAPGSGDVYNLKTGKPCPKPTVVSCAAGSGDLYDMNTGKRCSNTPLVACAPKSGDLYDVNTGKRCQNTLLVGCAAGSGDKYDMNTGKKCLNDTTGSCLKGSGDVYDMKTGKLCTTIATSNSISKLDTSIKSITNGSSKLLASTGELIGFPQENVSGDEEGASDLSGREKMLNSLTASAGRVGSIVSGPMSIWIILLIIAILLGGGYGVYGLLKKDKDNAVKPEASKPITPITKTQELPLAKPATPVTPEVKTVPQNTPNTVNTTPPATASVNQHS